MFRNLLYLICLTAGLHISNVKGDGYAVSAEVNQNLLALALDNDSHTSVQDTRLEFSKIWQKLGPFQIGTRGKFHLCTYVAYEEKGLRVAKI